MLKISLQALAASMACALLASCGDPTPETGATSKPKPHYEVPKAQIITDKSQPGATRQAQSAAATAAKPQAAAGTAKSQAQQRSSGSAASTNTLPPSTGLAGVADQGAIDSVVNYGTGGLALSIKKRSEEKLKGLQDKHNDALKKAGEQ